MANIFLSYARHDSDIVDSLVRDLEAEGHQVWLDREAIKGGDQWRRQIVNAIEGADVFLVVLSPNSTQSDNVRKELDLAEGENLQIMPVVIDFADIPPEMKYQLAGLQRIDLSYNYKQGFSKLLDALDNSQTAKEGPKKRKKQTLSKKSSVTPLKNIIRGMH